ncbi:hypothetical protein UT300005_18530 [Clostridium sp. CTA-5]
MIDIEILFILWFCSSVIANVSYINAEFSFDIAEIYVALFKICINIPFIFSILIWSSPFII